MTSTMVSTVMATKLVVSNNVASMGTFNGGDHSSHLLNYSVNLPQRVFAFFLSLVDAEFH